MGGGSNLRKSLQVKAIRDEHPNSDVTEQGDGIIVSPSAGYNFGDMEDLASTLWHELQHVTTEAPPGWDQMTPEQQQKWLDKQHAEIYDKQARLLECCFGLGPEDPRVTDRKAKAKEYREKASKNDAGGKNKDLRVEDGSGDKSTFKIVGDAEYPAVVLGRLEDSQPPTPFSEWKSPGVAVSLDLHNVTWLNGSGDHLAVLAGYDNDGEGVIELLELDSATGTIQALAQTLALPGVTPFRIAESTEDGVRELFILDRDLAKNSYAKIWRIEDSDGDDLLDSGSLTLWADSSVYPDLLGVNMIYPSGIAGEIMVDYAREYHILNGYSQRVVFADLDFDGYADQSELQTYWSF